jgi:hypothetical protein
VLIEAHRARIGVWKLQTEASLLRVKALLFFAIIRYHLLCFKHLGWRRLLIFMLKTPEHFKAIFLALFTHPSYPKETTGTPSAPIE